MNKYQGHCPKCGSDDWDWTNIGFTDAILCVNCGHIYNSVKGELTMTESEFNDLFDRGELDSQFADFICNRYDAWNKEKMLRLWQDADVCEAFKDTLVTSTLLQDTYFDGKHPLEAFPSIFGEGVPK
jgi:predicted nucleic-acid-binding Zn-ribbon protein